MSSKNIPLAFLLPAFCLLPPTSYLLLSTPYFSF